MAEARITEFFGETQTDGRSVRISRGSLGFHGIGIVHAKESLEVALPPTSSIAQRPNICVEEGHSNRCCGEILVWKQFFPDAHLCLDLFHAI